MGGGVKLYSDKREQQIAEQKKQQYTLHNPKIEDDSSAKSGKKVTWDCLWFGSYPQSQITKKDGEIYTTLKNADNWDKNGDVTINNIKYHKTEEVILSMNQLSGGYYNLKMEKPFYCPMLFWISKPIMRTMNILHGKKVH